MATVTRRQIRQTARLRQRLRRGALGVTAMVSATGLIAASLIGGAASASAAPVSYTVPGTYTEIVPAGACFVTATILGGAGSDFMLAGTAENRNGAGASVTAAFPVTAGQTVTVTVASGGTTHAGGAPGGGAPGVAGYLHGGGAGGGYSELSVGGVPLLVAGGGGGTGGGHADFAPALGTFSYVGHGGDAGLPTGTGIFAGTAGGDGVDHGRDSDHVFHVFRVGGGSGGSTVEGAAGLSNPNFGGHDGEPGNGRTGGKGGDDDYVDAGGGGGGGYRGGGGGSSTNESTVAGGGGGGGSSFVASTAIGAVTSARGPVVSQGPLGEEEAVPGAHGSASLVWGTAGCASATDDSKMNQPAGPIAVDVLYNDSGTFQPGSLQLLSGATPVASLPVAGEGIWTISGEDVVFTPLDTFLGNPTPIRYQWSTPGGSTVDAQVAVGYRPVANDDAKLNNPLGTAVSVPLLGNDVGALNAGATRLLNGPTPVTSLTVAGEGTWALSGGTVVFTPLTTFRGDPTPINYRITAVDGVTDDAKVTVTYRQSARDDVDAGNPVGDPVTVVVTGNDHVKLDPTTVRLLDPVTGDPLTTLTVDGEGTWTVDPTGAVTFTPEPGFEGNPTPLGYQVDNGIGGTPVKATVTVAYLPQAFDDAKLNQPLGSAVTLGLLGNDIGDLDPATVRVKHPVTGTFDTTVVVDGEGTWTVNPTNGEATFTPLPTFMGDPTPVDYTVDDLFGYETTAVATVSYRQEARPDVDAGNIADTEVTVDVAGNDHSTLDPTTVRLLDPLTGAPRDSVVVPGEGTWTVDPTGEVTFTPEPGFEGNPDPIGYQIDDGVGGPSVTSTVTVAYLPEARDDAKLNQPFGDPVTVPVVGNDIGDLDATSVRVKHPVTGTFGTTVVVVGEGIWVVDPVTGVVTFTPEPNFNGNPTPVGYVVDDIYGYPTEATITVTFKPDARDDVSGGHTAGDPVPVDVAANDFETLLPDTVRLIGPTGTPVLTLPVPGEGVWVVDPVTGVVTFTPEPSFTGDPTPVGYQIEDPTGEIVRATITVAYLPSAAPDASHGNVFGTAVTVGPLGNDTGVLDPTTVRLLDPVSGLPVLSATVAGEGVWTVDPVIGAVTFTPDPAFTGDPSPIGYEVTDVYGFSADSTITISYVPDARDDEDLDNVMGTSVTLDVTANDHDSIVPATVRLLEGSTPVTTLVVAGEGTWTVDAAGLVTFTPEAGFLLDPTPIGYVAEDAGGIEVTATITVTYLPEAAADEKLNNPFGESVLVTDVLGNDTGVFDRDSVRLVDSAGDPVMELVVPGEGTWLVRGNASILFTPEAGFTGNPTPIEYRVTDVTGDVVTATVTVTYLPTAVDDFGVGEEGDAVTVDVVGNDHDALDPTTVRLIDPTNTPVTTLVVPGEGTWTVDPATGEVTFTPEPTFIGNPTPVDYQIDGPDGSVVAKITVVYGPLALDDHSTGNDFGTQVDVDVLGNDLGVFEASSVRLIDNGTPVTTLVVPGEGVWTVDPGTGTITFTPEPSFTGDPTPVRYQVTDTGGKITDATVTVTYLPTAVDDSSLGNTKGDAVTVDVIGNDHDLLVSSTVRLLDPNGNPVSTLTVPGEGTWRVNPNGSITFTPLVGFEGDPTPVRYQVQTAAGDTVTAQVTVGYTDSALAFTGFTGGWMMLLSLLLLGIGTITLSSRRLLGSRKLLGH